MLFKPLQVNKDNKDRLSNACMCISIKIRVFSCVLYIAGKVDQMIDENGDKDDNETNS